MILEALKRIREGNKKIDRRVNKLLYGVEEPVRRPLRQKIVNSIAMVFMLGIIGLYGFTYGFYTGTGTVPFGPGGEESVMPPGIEQTSSVEVEEFVKADETDLNKYDVGFNCVEYALLQARNAHWKGIPAFVVKIDFENSENPHLILGFPTTDEGWIFLNPEGEVWIKPKVGGMLLDKKVVGVHYLSDFIWRAIEEVPK